jgi:signal transduction histidine kinase
MFRVLLIDADRTQTSRIPRDGIDANEFEIVTVGSVAAALREMHNRPPDAVLADLEVSAGDRLSTLAQLRAGLTPDTPVVVLSKADDPIQTREAIEAGADEVLTSDRADAPTIARTLRHAIYRSTFRRRAGHPETASCEAAEIEIPQAQKMEAIRRLAGGVAHEFNNVITAIFGYADLLLDSFDADHPARADVLEIKHAGERAANLTRQLLALSRKQVLQTRPINLNRTVGHMERLLSRVLGDKISLTIEIDPSLGETYADSGQLEHLLMNLAANAREAMPDGGRLSIATANDDIDQKAVIAFPGLSPGRFVRLTVTDSGPKLSEDVRRHIFEPFYTSQEQQGKGTGLSLATVYGIVKQSGGWIYASSGTDRGTTFTIFLPRSDDPATSSP